MCYRLLLYASKSKTHIRDTSKESPGLGGRDWQWVAFSSKCSNGYILPVKLGRLPLASAEAWQSPAPRAPDSGATQRQFLLVQVTN